MTTERRCFSAAMAVALVGSPLLARAATPLLASPTDRAPVALTPTSSKEIDMKKAALPSLVLALVLPAATAMAQSKMDDMKGMDMAKKPAAGAPTAHKAMGTVKKVDAKTVS